MRGQAGKQLSGSTLSLVFAVGASSVGGRSGAGWGLASQKRRCAEAPAMDLAVLVAPAVSCWFMSLKA